MKTVQIAAVMALVSTTAFAQDESARKVATEVAAARVQFEKTTKGAPYSAETVIEGTQVLADGNRINNKTTGRVYRDAEGRTRREDDRPNGSIGISIIDPVAGFSYSLDPVNKIAWKTSAGGVSTIMGKLEATMVEGQRKIEIENMAASQRQPAQVRSEQAAAEQGAVMAAGAGGGGRGRVLMRTGAPDPALGPLEHKTIEGVAVEGRKTTRVIPAGQVGNEQPITIVSEEWRSTDLNVLVQTRHSDPRMGDSSYRLLNIIRAEPDASLFIVPSDYTVKETGIRRMEPLRKQ